MVYWRKQPPIPTTFAWVIYRLRNEARWHDGKPVTPEDVIFSIEALKKNSPFYCLVLSSRCEGRKDWRTRL